MCARGADAQWQALLRAADAQPQLAIARERFVLGATADGKGNGYSAPVKYWRFFTLILRGVSDIRSVDEFSTRAERAAEETLMMDFVVFLVLCKPGGRKISVPTADKYTSIVQAWHRRQESSGGCSIGGGAAMFRLRAMIKGMTREIGTGQVRRRYGCRTQQLREAMDKCLAGGSPDELMWRAALSTGFCALMRGGELGRQQGERFDPALHLTRADLTFFRDAEGLLHARLQMRPLKKERMARIKGATVVLKEGGALLDPVRALWLMVTGDPVAREARAATPLFRKAGGAAIATDDVRAMVKALMGQVGCDPARFGAHSLRIGGATAALAAGVDAAVIKVLGRWSSDVYLIYTRLNREAAARAALQIGSQAFHDVERGPQTEEFDEILLPGQPSLASIAGDDESDGGDEEEA